jgi:hypothetical protein
MSGLNRKSGIEIIPIAALAYKHAHNKHHTTTMHLRFIVAVY